ncbi:MAG TPA: sugar transferase [Gaiellaceae bacterium]|nr:sugar transferase [Gaiellaceae bacterium]
MIASEHSPPLDGSRDATGAAPLRVPARRRRGWVVRRALLTADIAGLALALVVAEAFVGSRGAPDAVSLRTEFSLLVVAIPLWVLAAKVWGLYDRDEERTDHSTVDDVVGVFHLVTVGAWLLLVGSWATGWARPDPSKLALFWAAAITCVIAARGGARVLCRRSGSYTQRTVVAGADPIGQAVARKCMRHGEYRIEVIGFVDGRPGARASDVAQLPVLGPLSALPRLATDESVDRVVVAFPADEADVDVPALIRSLQDAGIQVDVVPRFGDLAASRVGFHAVEGVPLIGLTPPRLARSSRALKRAIDVVGSGVGLVVAAPLFAFIATAVKLTSPGPIFFRQVRVGRDQQKFVMLKFRTMRRGVDDSAHRAYIRASIEPERATTDNGLFKLERADAVTPVGRWLRRTSLDELPQLVNVLRGEMSLVGPRPCLEYEIEHFRAEHFERFYVPPGMTGLWQVTARAQSTFGEALDLDVAYVRSWSVGLDLWLLARTPARVFGRTA